MALDTWVPPEAAGTGARVVLIGTRAVIVEGHCGLLGFDERAVCARVPGGALRVEGERLAVSFYARGEMRVTGRVKGVWYED